MHRSRRSGSIGRAWLAVPLAALVLGQSGTAVAADRPLAARPSTGLSVYTTPDPSPVASAAYVYSPVALAEAPTLQVSAPHGRTTIVHTVFSQDAAPGQWWTAPLPGGSPGIRTVIATARTATRTTVRGRATYEITGSSPTFGPHWTAAGPGSVGGLLAIAPQDSRDLYVASALSSELYASHDSGQSWQLLRTLPVAGGYPTALLALPGRQQRLVLSINGGNGGAVEDPTYTGKVFESGDGGRSWRDLHAPDAFAYTVLATPDGRTLAAVTGTGINLTSDDGRSWRHVAIPWAQTAYSGASIIGDDLYVATVTGLYVLRHVSTATASATPQLAFTPPSGRSAWVSAVAGDAHALYAVAWSGGVFTSHDDGDTWTHVYDPSGYVNLVSDVDGVLYVEAGNTLAIGHKDGQVWTSESVPVPNATYNAIVAVGKALYLSSTDTGVFRSTDGGATFRYVNGVAGLSVYSVGVAHGRVIAGTPSDTVDTTVTNATSTHPQLWTAPVAKTVSGTAIPLVASTPDDSVTYKVRSGPRIGTYTIYSSADGGVSWAQLATFYGSPGALLVDPADPDDVYVSGKSSFDGTVLDVSHDAGKTWSTATLPDTGWALAGDPTDPARLWLGGPAGLWSSSDGAATFSRLDSTPVSAVGVLPDHRLVIGGTQLRYSDNGGQTIRVAAQPALDLSVSSVLASPRYPNVLFAGTATFHDAGLVKGGHGVLASVDGGARWFEYNVGLDDLDVTSLAITPDGRRLFAGTTMGGVFSRPISPTDLR